MARDLEADLKLCDAVDTSAAWLYHSTFANAAREGWRETILELMEARKRIADLEETTSWLRNALRSARRRAKELKDILDE